MRFLSLGPFLAIDQGELVDLGRRQERFVLGLLLVEPGTQVGWHAWRICSGTVSHRTGPAG
jgi:hypothetical protein